MPGAPHLNLMRAGLATIWLALSVALAGAQSLPPEDLTRRLLLQALDNIQRARCGETQLCAPATAAEKANPPLAIAEAQRIIQRAILSASGEHCGLDWQRKNFLPMMAYWRVVQKKTERQMALVALLHGIMMGQGQQALAAKPACTEQERQIMELRLPFRP